MLWDIATKFGDDYSLPDGSGGSHYCTSSSFNNIICGKEMTNKERDFMRIVRYLLSTRGRVITMQNVREMPNVEKLRAFPILYQLYLDGRIEVTKRSFWGIPEEFKLKNNNKRVVC